MDTLEELFVEQLKDVYSAEKQLTRALPKMAKAANASELQDAFKEHLAQTEEHVSRLEAVCKELGEKPGGKKCAAMEGLIKESQELLEEEPAPEVLDAGLIAAAQRVEHYEIAAYGTLLAFAKTLGKKSVLKLLEKTLAEEVETDELLSNLAESKVNKLALSPKAEDEDEKASSAKRRGSK